eukprot:jgi/Galph1/1283/GphlegSOOS_G5940.1
MKDVGMRFCVICLDSPKNSTFCEPCFHAFCYSCLKRWFLSLKEDEKTATCPVCKREVISLVYDIRSDKDYKRRPPHSVLSKKRKRVETKRYVETTSLFDEEPGFLNDQHVFRRLIYAQHLWVQPLPSSLYRQSTSEQCYFIEANSKLLPWLRRELQALCGVEDVQILVEHIYGKIESRCSREELRNELEPFLFEHANHFLHELYQFAVSSYDMETYDRLVRYVHHPENLSEK